MSGIRISVVMATYQGAPFVADQVTSLLASLGPDDEIVASDDGSTDGTLALLRGISDLRLRVLPPGPRLGYRGNFARAVAASRGRLVLFSDQDDICLPARIPRSLAALAHTDMVCGDARVVDEHLGLLADSFFDLRRAKFGALDLFLRPAVIGATMGLRREALMASMPFPPGLPHDMWLSVRAARRDSLSVVREPFILYRRHGANASVTCSNSRRALPMIMAERFRLARALQTHGQGPG